MNRQAFIEAVIQLVRDLPQARDISYESHDGLKVNPNALIHVTLGADIPRFINLPYELIVDTLDSNNENLIQSTLEKIKRCLQWYYENRPDGDPQFIITSQVLQSF